MRYATEENLLIFYKGLELYYVSPCEYDKAPAFCQSKIDLCMNQRKLIEVGVFIWMNLKNNFDSSKMKINLVYTKILVGAYNSSETRSLH